MEQIPGLFMQKGHQVTDIWGFSQKPGLYFNPLLEQKG